MAFTALWVAALLAPPLPTPSHTLSPRDSTAVVDSVRALDSTFVWSWRFTWEASEGLRHVLNGGPLTTKDRLTPTPTPGLETSILVPGRWGVRLPLLHCHFDGEWMLYQVDEYVIKSGAGKRGTCPSWYSVCRSCQPTDERLGIDVGIASGLRSGIRNARDSLLTALDHAGSLLPGDQWIVGQRVQFAARPGRHGTRAGRRHDLRRARVVVPRAARLRPVRARRGRAGRHALRIGGSRDAPGTAVHLD